MIYYTIKLHNKICRCRFEKKIIDNVTTHILLIQLNLNITKLKVTVKEK